MEIKHFDLHELYGHFSNVAEENNRILLQLEALERKFKPLKSKDEKFSLKHIKYIQDDYGFMVWWKMPEISEEDLAKCGIDFRNLGPKDEKSIGDLYDILKNIEIVSIILRCVAPDYYGIISPPVENLLNVQGSTHTKKYISYLENLEKLQEDYGFLKIAHVDMALWTLAQIINSKELQHHYIYGKYYRSYKETMNIIKKIIAENLFKPVLEEDLLYKAELFLETDHILAGIIAFRELDLLVKVLCDKEGLKIKKRPSRGGKYPRFHDYLEKLTIKHYISKEKSSQIDEWWRRLRNPLMHDPQLQDPLGKEEVSKIINEIKLLKKDNPI